MCVNQNCVSVSSVFKADCPRKCNSNGECNNLGQCHCKVGFSPPYCDYPGPGGSEGSGPASDPNGIIIIIPFHKMTSTFCIHYF